MFCVELTFDDNPARLQARPKHRELLAALYEAGEAVVAGPFTDQSGAVLVFDVDEARLREILAADAYYSTPGVTVSSVRELTAVVGPSR